MVHELLQTYMVYILPAVNPTGAQENHSQPRSLYVLSHTDFEVSRTFLSHARPFTAVHMPITVWPLTYNKILTLSFTPKEYHILSEFEVRETFVDLRRPLIYTQIKSQPRSVYVLNTLTLTHLALSLEKQAFMRFCGTYIHKFTQGRNNIKFP